MADISKVNISNNNYDIKDSKAIHLKQLTNEDLNTVTEYGWYYANSDNTCNTHINWWTKGTKFSLEVKPMAIVEGDTGDTICQTLMTGSYIYIRYLAKYMNDWLVGIPWTENSGYLLSSDKQKLNALGTASTKDIDESVTADSTNLPTSEAVISYVEGKGYKTSDTKNTAGSTNSSSKLFLIGATSQAANPQTYSHDTAYVGTDGCLYSGGVKVLTDQDITGKLDKSGGTMTGALTLKANQYHTSDAFGLDCKNSDLINVNSIYTADGITGSNEGIRFYRDGETWDSLCASGGTLYFAPNDPLTGTKLADCKKVAMTSDIPTVKTASSGGTDVSLVTTGEKYIWDNERAIVKLLDTNVDLNDIKTVGFYNVGNNTILNTPLPDLTTSNAFGLQVIRISSSMNYFAQIYYRFKTNEVYRRNYNNGTWSNWEQDKLTDTKNTAGSTDTSSKIYLIGATAQSANPQTYSDNEVFATSGVLTTKSVQIGGGSVTLAYDSTNQCLNFNFT